MRLALPEIAPEPPQGAPAALEARELGLVDASHPRLGAAREAVALGLGRHELELHATSSRPTPVSLRHSSRFHRQASTHS